MRGNCGFWVVALAFLLLLVFPAPQSAFADSLSAPVGGAYPGPIAGVPPNPMPPVTNLCPANNTIDTAAATSTAAQVQVLFMAATNIESQFPVAQSMDQCLKNVMTIFSSLPSLASPNAIGAAMMTAFSSLISGIIGQVCSAVMATVTSAAQGLMNLTKICLPMPTFGGFDIPGPLFQSSRCSGMQFNLLNSSPPGSVSSTAIYNYSQYLTP